MNQHLEQVEESKLQDLADDPRNIVYHWKSSDPLTPEEVVPLDRVASMIRRLFEEYDTKRKKIISKNIHFTDKVCGKLKSHLMKNPEWKRFDQTHPNIVNRVIATETTEKDIVALEAMIALKKKVLNGNLADMEGKKKLEDYIIKTFAQTKKEYEKDVKKRGLVSKEFKVTNV